MKILNKIALFILIIALFNSCGKDVTKEKGIENLPKNECCPDGNGLLPAGINSGDNYNSVRSMFQEYKNPNINKADKYKDYASFVEYDPINPEKEIYWFSSSRFDSLKNETVMYGHLYFCERDLSYSDNGYCLSEGWSSPEKFITSDKNFNQRTYGTIAIAGDVMIFSAEESFDAPSVLGAGQLLDLWMLKKKDKNKTFAEQSGQLKPEKLNVLNINSGSKETQTWESQPTLSKDGKHIFYISDRPLLTDSEQKRSDLNIWYSKLDDDENWTQPVAVADLNTEYNEYTPQIGPDGKYLFFASDRQGGKGGYDLYAAEFKNGQIGTEFGVVQSAEYLLTNKTCGPQLRNKELNTSYDDIFPFFYENEQNKKFNKKNKYYDAEY